MSRYTRYPCQRCQGSRNILFCRECAQLICKKCINQIEIIELFCNSCQKNRNGEICGTCGNTCQVINKTEKFCCPNCSSTSLGDPGILLKNLASEFLSIISNVKEVHPNLNELHRTFEFYVTMVRLCRLAGLSGFPQVEEQLEKCSKGLSLITKKGINQLSKVRQEALFDLRHIEYFKNIQLENYRNAEAILRSTEKSIQQISVMIGCWIEEVGVELELLSKLAFPLRRHYEILSKVSHVLPESIFNIAAIIPPVGMNIQVRKQMMKTHAFIIFTEEFIICLPDDIKKIKKIRQGKVKFSYRDILKISINHSILKGNQLIITLINGHIKISASPFVIDVIKEYFDLILSGEPFMVGSDKTIITIEENAPNKGDYKYATNKFIDIFRERLFGTSVQNSYSSPFQSSSIRELRNKIGNLQNDVRELDNQAKNREVDYENYQSQRNQIKQNMRFIQDNIKSIQDNLVGDHLGGHITKNMNSNKSISSDNFNLFDKMSDT